MRLQIFCVLGVLSCAGASHVVGAQQVIQQVAQASPTHLPDPAAPVYHVAVAAHDIARGATLTNADIRWVDSTIANTKPAHVNVAAGWIARRSIRTGELLESPSVSLPTLVASGDVVDALYINDGVRLTLKGTAIGDGALGDEVYVRLDTRKRLRAIVLDEHTVRIVE